MRGGTVRLWPQVWKSVLNHTLELHSYGYDLLSVEDITCNPLQVWASDTDVIQLGSESQIWSLAPYKGI